jgi:hypothetical protein
MDGERRDASYGTYITAAEGGPDAARRDQHEVSVDFSFSGGAGAVTIQRRNPAVETIVTSRRLKNTWLAPRSPRVPDSSKHKLEAAEGGSDAKRRNQHEVSVDFFFHGPGGCPGKAGYSPVLMWISSFQWTIKT